MAKASLSLKISLCAMASLILFGLIFPTTFKNLFSHPEVHLYAKFFHVLSVTTVFANALIGTLWETRGLLSRKAPVIRYTYQTVTWLDSVLTAPLILIAVVSGVLMATNLGGVWTIGWLSVAFVTFLFSGLIWVVLDIPTQYRVNRLFKGLDEKKDVLPSQVMGLLWFRLGVNIFSLFPLIAIFVLMIFKPELKPIGEWFRLH
ncbi:DUF2269 family protein [bacterium]|nr:DUF2269 family protein [bacterium]